MVLSIGEMANAHGFAFAKTRLPIEDFHHSREMQPFRLRPVINW
jgi:hypothetical protein